MVKNNSKRKTWKTPIFINLSRKYALILGINGNVSDSVYHLIHHPAKTMILIMARVIIYNINRIRLTNSINRFDWLYNILLSQNEENMSTLDGKVI